MALKTKDIKLKDITAWSGDNTEELLELINSYDGCSALYNKDHDMIKVDLHGHQIEFEKPGQDAILVFDKALVWADYSVAALIVDL